MRHTSLIPMIEDGLKQRKNKLKIFKLEIDHFDFEFLNQNIYKLILADSDYFVNHLISNLVNANKSIKVLSLPNI